MRAKPRTPYTSNQSVQRFTNVKRPLLSSYLVTRTSCVPLHQANKDTSVVHQEERKKDRPTNKPQRSLVVRIKVTKIKTDSEKDNVARGPITTDLKVENSTNVIDAVLRIKGVIDKSIEDELVLCDSLEKLQHLEISMETLENSSEYAKDMSAVIVDDAEGKSRGFGFVNFESHKEAKKAKETLNDAEIGSKKWFIGTAMKKSERDAVLKRVHQKQTPVSQICCKEEYDRHLQTLASSQYLFPYRGILPKSAEKEGLAAKLQKPLETQVELEGLVPSLLKPMRNRVVDRSVTFGLNPILEVKNLLRGTDCYEFILNEHVSYTCPKVKDEKDNVARGPITTDLKVENSTNVIDAVLRIKGVIDKSIEDELVLCDSLEKLQHLEISMETLENSSEYAKDMSAVIVDDAEGKSRGFGFVNFESHKEAKKAKETLNDAEIGSKKWFIGTAMKKSERDAVLKRVHQKQTPVSQICCKEEYDRHLQTLASSQYLFPYRGILPKSAEKEGLAAKLQKPLETQVELEGLVPSLLKPMRNRVVDRSVTFGLNPILEVKNLLRGTDCYEFILNEHVSYTCPKVKDGQRPPNTS
ncbi:RNA recognition motif domain, eukaryote, Nucleotide-binding alpha-beta plait domain protein [Artemisia annua]|uniref:RNA recognition motif domain, eukaryote, Nucleotide-binding alpha-beta plait domain protein n=1 Tax=Artemisia annua TaxID=35608 RepID=A0A2U1MLY0_ARTAN|nr:RNA recognition motif domain, eukaryote, Nucleotide-binding alpha-beta plait domain protein [Artemisia annua]